MKKKNSQSLEIRLDNIIFYLICLLAAIAPLVILPGVRQVYSLPKAFFLQIGAAAAGLLWSAKFLFVSPTFRRTHLNLPVLAFFGFASLSTLFTIRPYMAIFGGYGRLEGFLTLAAYGIIFFVGSQLIWDKPRLEWFLKAMTIGAMLVSIYGLIQYFGYDFLPYVFQYEKGRTYSTIGNPSLLANYLVIVLPMAVGLYLAVDSEKGKLLFGLGTPVIFAALITTFARGGWIAALAALIAFMLLIGGRYRRRLIVLSLFLVIVFGVFFTLKTGSSVTTLSSRISSIVKISEGSTAQRFEIWKAAAGVIADRPLLGSGPDTFVLTYPRYETVPMAGDNELADNTHNWTLQLAATLGVPAAISFLFIFSLFFWQGTALAKNHKDQVERILLSAIVAGALGYFIATLATVTIVEGGLVVWLLFGIVASSHKPSVQKISWRKEIFPLRLALFLCLILLAFLLLYFLTKFLIADIHYESGNRLGKQGYFVESLSHYSAAISLNEYEDRYLSGLAELYKVKRLTLKSVQDLDKEIKVLKTAQTLNPMVLNHYWDLADAYIWTGDFLKKPSYFKAAISQLKKAKELMPNSARTHYLLALSYFDLGDNDRALPEALKAVRPRPNIPKAYYVLGLLYEAAGKKDRAAFQFNQALGLKKDFPEARTALFRVSGK